VSFPQSSSDAPAKAKSKAKSKPTEKEKKPTEKEKKKKKKSKRQSSKSAMVLHSRFFFLFPPFADRLVVVSGGNQLSQTGVMQAVRKNMFADEVLIAPTDITRLAAAFDKDGIGTSALHHQAFFLFLYPATSLLPAPPRPWPFTQ
jgi:hypothetical protein